MRKINISKPFFSFNPKSYLYGETLLKYAKIADRIALNLNISIIMSAPYVDLPVLVKNTNNIIVTAQHMDAMRPGIGMGGVLPDSLASIGTNATFLNHAEKPMHYSEIENAVKLARKLNIITIVCASSVKEAEALAYLSPDVLLCEPTELIGTGKVSDLSYIKDTNRVIRKIDPNILIMQAAGISKPQDAYHAIRAGADGTGCTSGILKATNPFQMFEDMVRATKKAYSAIG